MKKILVVDDSPTMRRMVIASLQRLKDINCSEASSGLEAIEQLAISVVDIMILDLNMPDMHGLEVLKFIRNQRAYQKLPVIVLTTRGDEMSRSAVAAAGGTLYLTKPFEPNQLCSQVDQLLHKADN